MIIDIILQIVLITGGIVFAVKAFDILLDLEKQKDINRRNRQ